MAAKSQRRCRFGKIYNGGSMGSTTNLFYLMHPVTLSGVASEGGTPTITVDTTKSFLCFVTGPKAPVVDEIYPCYLSPEGYWYAERMKTTTTGTTVSYPCGSCTVIPSTLTLTLSSSSCGALPYSSPSTLTYQSTPSWASTFGLGSNTFMSNSTYIDGNGDYYNYFMKCTSNKYSIFIGYEVNNAFGGGGPYFPNQVVFGWSTSGTNTCSPFSMTSLSGGINNSGGCTSAHLTG